jgi:hypothetical protein
VVYETTVTDPATGEVFRSTTVAFDPIPARAAFATPEITVTEPAGLEFVEVSLVRLSDPRVLAGVRVITRDVTARGREDSPGPAPDADFLHTNVSSPSRPASRPRRCRSP